MWIPLWINQEFRLFILGLDCPVRIKRDPPVSASRTRCDGTRVHDHQDNGDDNDGCSVIPLNLLHFLWRPQIVLLTLQYFKNKPQLPNCRLTHPVFVFPGDGSDENKKTEHVDRGGEEQQKPQEKWTQHLESEEQVSEAGFCVSHVRSLSQNKTRQEKTSWISEQYKVNEKMDSGSILDPVLRTKKRFASHTIVEFTREQEARLKWSQQRGKSSSGLGVCEAVLKLLEIV